jgi:hypothetical protein
VKASIKLEGMDELQRALAKLTTEMQAEAASVVEETTRIVHDDIISMYRAGSGPSALGQPPAEDSGQLVAGMGHQMTGKLSGEVTNTAGHAMHLEFGTQSIRPRPAFRPAALRNLRKFNAKMTTALSRVIR